MIYLITRGVFAQKCQNLQCLRRKARKTKASFILRCSNAIWALMTVVTRFAPSPTGFLHIGGARTALFNFLFAKRHNGKFLLRIEDTDRKRSTPEAVAAILEGMEWLGLTGDDEPIFQFERSDRHVEVAEQMVAAGKAFRCYVTPEELQARRDDGEAKRKAAKAEGLPEDKRHQLLEEAEALLKPFRSPYRDSPLDPDDTTAIHRSAAGTGYGILEY